MARITAEQRHRARGLYFEYVRLEHIAEQCGISLRTVRKWVDKGWREEREDKAAEVVKKGLRISEPALQKLGQACDLSLGLLIRHLTKYSNLSERELLTVRELESLTEIMLNLDKIRRAEGEGEELPPAEGEETFTLNDLRRAARLDRYLESQGGKVIDVNAEDL